MSSGLAFLAWARRGISTAIATDESAAERATVDIQLTFNQPTAPLSAGVELELYGPGEIIGFDTRAISRVYPSKNATDVEPNYFPALELHEADLPWRYTPAHSPKALTPGNPNARDRIRPWLCLIALRDHEDEIAGYTPAGSDRKLDVVSIKPAARMPIASQAWAWAHTQLAAVDVPNPLEPNHDYTSEVAQSIETQPYRLISRLLCPRHLEASTNYWVMLVPVFKHAAEAGCGVALTGTNPLADAWEQARSENLDLPVYYRWRFRTGTGGDFESLVRLIKPATLPATIGLRDMDVTRPGGGLVQAAQAPLAVEGALRAVEMESTTWPSGEKSAWITDLSELLNLPDGARVPGGPDPLIVPPLYGMWHARRRRYGAYGGALPVVWFDQLNEDPRTRVAAGLGTQVVQKDQRQLMASAWEQVGEIREINDRLRRAQFARELALNLHARYIEPATAEAILFLTKPVQGRVLHTTGGAGVKTVLSLVRNSPPRQALLSGAWRRLARPLGALGRRQGRADMTPADVISNVNLQTAGWVPAPMPSAPTPFTSHAWVSSLLVGGLPVYASWSGSQTSIPSTQRPLEIAWDPIYDPFKLEPEEPTGTNGDDSPSMALFRSAATKLQSPTLRTLAPTAGATLHELAPTGLKNTVRDALDPAVTIPTSLVDRLTKAPGFAFDPVDPIEPVMAHPKFVRPMYEPLATLSQDWVLPGIDKVPPNSVSLVETNSAFIEAYMVGLNHEMSRELLWNEYPTDQRGTYFRQFWDPSGYVDPSEVELSNEDQEALDEELTDITPIHTWPVASALGQHPSKVELDPAQIVLLVRGELLRRYPNTIVYAVQATDIGGGVRGPSNNRLSPIFSGKLDPDIHFFGFNLSEEDVHGQTATDGWYFCFEEQPSQPKFGLDVSGPGSLSTWADLAWSHFPTARDTNGYLDLDSEGPTDVINDPQAPPANARLHAETGASDTIGARASDLAYITFQKPVRVLVHASEMLP